MAHLHSRGVGSDSMEHKRSDPGGANTVNITQSDIVVALFAHEFHNCSHVAEDLDKARAKMDAFSGGVLRLQ